MLVAEDETQSVLTATENGYGKRTSIVEYTRHGRGTKGMIAIQQSERNGKVVAATLVHSDDEIMLITDTGVLVRTRVAEIRELGRATQGVTLIALDDGSSLTGLQRIVENDANGDIDPESGAIVEYLVETYGQGRLAPAPGTPDRLRYTYWLHYAEGSAMPLLLQKLLFTLAPRRMPGLLRPIVKPVFDKMLATLVDPQLKQHIGFWEGELSRSEWFAGSEFTAADIQMSFPLEAASARAGLDASYPKAWAWLERIHARPAYNRALEKGGPYQVGR